jgi:hypothetical protein
MGAKENTAAILWRERSRDSNMTSQARMRIVGDAV